MTPEEISYARRAWELTVVPIIGTRAPTTAERDWVAIPSSIEVPSTCPDNVAFCVDISGGTATPRGSWPWYTGVSYCRPDHSPQPTIGVKFGQIYDAAFGGAP